MTACPRGAPCVIAPAGKDAPPAMREWILAFAHSPIAPADTGGSEVVSTPSPTPPTAARGIGALTPMSHPTPPERPDVSVPFTLRQPHARSRPANRSGLARVDIFLEEDGAAVLNEVRVVDRPVEHLLDAEQVVESRHGLGMVGGSRAAGRLAAPPGASPLGGAWGVGGPRVVRSREHAWGADAGLVCDRVGSTRVLSQGGVVGRAVGARQGGDD